jgi:4'-phosphopantetheinyl transferase
VEGSDVHFNLSHSGKWALIAVSEGAEVGVDVENVRRPDDLPAVARRLFSTGEQEALNRLTEEKYAQAFYRCWTRKEAVLKALGFGLSVDPTTIHVGIQPFDDVAEVRTPLRPEMTCTLMDLRLDDGHAAAVAVSGTWGCCELKDWRPWLHHWTSQTARATPRQS